MNWEALSLEKDIKNKECLTNDHQCTQNQVAVNDYINSQVSSPTSETPFMETLAF